jgi:hypothetical protein
MTHSPWPARRFLLASAAPLVLAGLFTGAGPAAAQTQASAASCTTWTTGSAKNPGSVSDDLFAVAALSPSSVWAVGDDTSASTFVPLAEHWNGSSWAVTPVSDPGHDADLASIDAVSASNIWAVGAYATKAGTFLENKTLIEHWNGTKWAQVPSPSPGTSFNVLNSVGGSSATNIWAVGFDAKGTSADQTLVLHWNGTKWAQVPSPNPGAKGNNNLNSVVATSASDAWALGTFSTSNSTPSQSLALHWNGSSWKQVTTVNPGGGSEFVGGSTTSANDAWAVGDSASGGSLTEHWNGTKWAAVSSPNGVSGDINQLDGVTQTSASNAWAVGTAKFEITPTAGFILHWTGGKWAKEPAINAGATWGLFGVAADSASDVWAVGSVSQNPQFTNETTLVLHCH